MWLRWDEWLQVWERTEDVVRVDNGAGVEQRYAPRLRGDDDPWSRREGGAVVQARWPS